MLYEQTSGWDIKRNTVADNNVFIHKYLKPIPRG